MSPDLQTILLENELLIRSVCRTFYREKADQDDLFQEIAVRVISAYPGFRKESKLSTWIFRIAINTAVTWSKKKKLFTFSFSEETSGFRTEDQKEITGERDIDFLYRAINRLDKIEKAIIHLYLEENSYAEIAEIIGITEKNVSVRIVRIKRKLKDLMTELQ